MRIGIFTLKLNNNYGGLLQAFALQNVLEQMGHSVTVLDAPQKYTLPNGKKSVIFCKRVVKKILGHNVEIFRERRLNKEYSIVNKYFLRFLNEYINRLEVKKINRLCENDYDAIIVGSDQVWRPKYCRQGKIEHSFLDFAFNWNIKRIAYAASFGTDKWEYSSGQTKRCAALIKKFDSVSVREASGVELCKANFQRNDVVHVLDPSLLLDIQVYKDIINKHPVEKKAGELSAYILDESSKKREITGFIAEAVGMTVYNSGVKIRKPTKPVSERICASIEEWLSDFYNAKYVVTDSFHGCVFSILFKKQFIVFGNKVRGLARFSSLLSVLGIEDRIIDESTSQDRIKEIISTEIDFDKVEAVLNVKREESKAYLKNALEG